MTPPADTERYKHHRFPGEIISHGVWLYHRFHLSYRDVRELLFARGIDVTYEAIRHWCLKFGQDYANRLRRRRPRPGDTWHLDEVFLTIKGKRHYLWRGLCQLIVCQRGYEVGRHVVSFEMRLMQRLSGSSFPASFGSVASSPRDRWWQGVGAVEGGSAARSDYRRRESAGRDPVT